MATMHLLSGLPANDTDPARAQVARDFIDLETRIAMARGRLDDLLVVLQTAVALASVKSEVKS